MDAALYQRLLPFVCAQPDDALQVNVNTLRPSQAALLVALFPGELTLQEAQQLCTTAREPGGAASLRFSRSRRCRNPIPRLPAPG